MKEKIQLSDHFTYTRLLRFVAPSIVMMIFTSIYGVVDGLFVSNFVGKTEFAALNLVMPLLIIMGAIGFMIGAGGTAVVAKTLGMGEKDKANEYFSLLVYVTVIAGVALGVIGILCARPVAIFLGAEGEMIDFCVIYARINLIALPCFMLQNIFQTFFITAEKPKLGLTITVMAGVTNMVLDALFVAVFDFGLEGAAAATALSQAVGGLVPLIYFGRKNSSLLKLGKTKFYGKTLLATCINGSSELMSNISMSLVGMLYNIQLMKYAGENGVAAYGVLMYVGFVFNSIFIGYSIGTAPVVGFHFGSDNREELKGILKRSTMIISACSLCMVIISELLAKPFSQIFVGYDPDLFELTSRGFFVYSFSFLFSGMAIYGSSFFTALNDGLTSAIISFLRTLVFQIAAVLVLPLIWGIDGVWISIVVAEFMAVVVTLIFLFCKRKKYGYF